MIAAVHPDASLSRIFVISDLHLGHANIIKYSGRPFSDVHEMNHMLIQNWNSVVRKSDTVIYLGDWCYGKGNKSIQFWHSKLHGRIINIRGNHDKSKTVNLRSHCVLNHKCREFLLIHDPCQAPSDWDGWIIHGHHHNSDVRRFPFINPEMQRANVCCEMIGYTPISLDRLLALIERCNGKKMTYLHNFVD